MVWALLEGSGSAAPSRVRRQRSEREVATGGRAGPHTRATAPLPSFSALPATARLLQRLRVRQQLGVHRAGDGDQEADGRHRQVVLLAFCHWRCHCFCFDVWFLFWEGGGGLKGGFEGGVGLQAAAAEQQGSEHAAAGKRPRKPQKPKGTRRSPACSAAAPGSPSTPLLFNKTTKTEDARLPRPQRQLHQQLPHVGGEGGQEALELVLIYFKKQVHVGADGGLERVDRRLGVGRHGSGRQARVLVRQVVVEFGHPGLQLRLEQLRDTIVWFLGGLGGMRGRERGGERTVEECPPGEGLQFRGLGENGGGREGA